MTKYVRMLNNGTAMLNEILQTGNNTGNMGVHGYNNQAEKNHKQVVEFVSQRMKQ